MILYVLAEIENETDQQFMLSLYEKYKPIMFGTVRKYVSDYFVVEDLVQDSLVKLIPKIATLKELERCKLDAYIVYTVRNTAFNYFKANRKNISGSIQIDNVDYLLHIEDLQGVGASKDISLASFVAMCSSALKKPMLGSLVILGSMSIGGTIGKVEELANTLQVCFDSGAKKILLPMSSAGDISSVPSDLFSKFNISFYNDPEDAVFKALGIE